ncbi:MCE family protein [Nocardioides immobilis]|uniref:MCE family protein n=1 Tax=Nocardioides immobilis TaxID=2049295 RepID=A0A417XRY9_9ACTN|nr:MCE family protein [Nocardioides immobilis]RHW22830.1 MCE family protein [Nocardioides immobilis]
MIDRSLHLARRPWFFGPLALILVVVGTTGWNRADRTDLVAYFASTDGIYAGDEVRILGVPVGKIDDIETEDGQVRVEFHVNGDVKVPADAKAVIVAPSLVSSRYLQLTPRYDGGAEMAEGATIPLDRTAVPVEWDQIKGQVNDLAVALGPHGANEDGALSDLVDASAHALRGQGGTINQTIADLASAIEVLNAGGDDAFSTVRNLQVFVSALAHSDVQIAEFIQRLDTVSQLLADDKHLVRAALRDLGTAVGDVEGFVREHRGALSETMRGLTDILGVVARQQGDLAQILHVAPNAMANMAEAYHQRQNAIGVNAVGANIHSPGQLLCGALGGAAATDEAGTERLCNRLIGNLLNQVANDPQSQQLLSALLVLLAGAR